METRDVASVMIAGINNPKSDAGHTGFDAATDLPQLPLIMETPNPTWFNNSSEDDTGWSWVMLNLAG